MRIIPLLFLIFFSFSVQCQFTSLTLLKQKFNSETKRKLYNKAQEHLSGDNEVQFLVTNTFLFYKRYISSQDISSCNFTPSCSEYAIQAVKSQGIVIGVINFFDRFTRCNGLNAENYSFSKDKKLLFDPVRNMKGDVLNEN